MGEVEREAQDLRAEQLRLAVDAQMIMGEAAEYVTPVEHELRVHVHDVVHPHHERDFRSLAVFALEALSEAKVAVLRSDYKGKLIVESVVGSQWVEGGWHLWLLIWRGHMTLLQPPEDLGPGPWLQQEEVSSTPVMGFGFFWHTRHDQALCAPGRVACRLCKPARRAGEDLGHAVRRHSCLAEVASVSGGHWCGGGSDVKRVIRPAGDGPGLLFRELFAGKAILTTAWKDAGGRALEPVEVYEDPHQKDGFRPEHDLLDPSVQSFHMTSALQGPENVSWIAAPCTSYCDWNLQNGGSCTFAAPQGGQKKPMTEKEVQGNGMSEFAADYFELMMDNGGFPVCESSAVSGRYPKQWHLPCWQRIFGRADVDFIEVDMCAYGLGPPDEEGLYLHRTRLVFPRHDGVRQALLRLCAGVSPTHRHIALKGCRPGSLVTRCTEAGVYCQEFVQAVVKALHAGLIGGGYWFRIYLTKSVCRGSLGTRNDRDFERFGTQTGNHYIEIIFNGRFFSGTWLRDFDGIYFRNFFKGNSACGAYFIDSLEGKYLHGAYFRDYLNEYFRGGSFGYGIYGGDYFIKLVIEHFGGAYCHGVWRGEGWRSWSKGP